MARTTKFVDITGQTFGKYTVISRDPHPSGQRYLCRCSCGTERVHQAPALQGGRVTMCRACRAKLKTLDLTGHVYGKWTAIKLVRKRTWLCKCECGTEAEVDTGNLRGGGSTQCDKCRLDAIHQPKHGHAAALEVSPTYRVWVSLKSRCLDPNQHIFKYYGGEGVCVCDGWKDSFANFLASMGERPPGDFSIDRENKDESTKHYSCGTCPQCVTNGWKFHCKWATDAEQARNKRNNRHLTYNGRTLVITDWARELGIAQGTLSQRLDVLGWSVEKTLSTPVRVHRKF